MFGKCDETRSLVFDILLDILTVNNIYRLEVLKVSHSWHNGLLPKVIDDIYFNMLQAVARILHGAGGGGDESRGVGGTKSRAPQERERRGVLGYPPPGNFENNRLSWTAFCEF